LAGIECLLSANESIQPAYQSIFRVWYALLKFFIFSSVYEVEMLTSSKSSQRFNLLLLYEGEYYFEDFSAFYYPSGLDDEQAFKRRVKGRLKLCSSSILFDPEEIKLPIMKFPFRYVDLLARWESSLWSLLPAKADILLLRSTLYIEMKENNLNSPYVTKEGKKDHRFSLNYISLSSVLPRMNVLHNISQKLSDRGLYLSSDYEQDLATNELRKLIEERENSIAFDSSAIDDISEQILFETNAIRVAPLINNPGKILITDRILYFQAFNNISINPVEKFPLKSMTHIMKRRYILRPVAMEILCSDSDSLFLTFKTMTLRDSVYDILLKQSLVLQNLCFDDQLNMTLKWQNGLISNYDYLMYLNSSAGRTFNDLTQYPVFPWIIADYESSVLDLKKPETFRNLIKPIGALNPDRLKMFQARMAQMPDDQPKFLYGTHYSNPGYVLFFLVREVPEYMLRLQNGKFDSPSRTFHSIAETWQGVLRNPADVKEMIPEFYDVSKKGTFLRNTQKLNLGVKENGVMIDDVILPPWAEDAEDFVNKMNEALESDYISERLHNWIDLIFGYKQQGPEAVKADNLFYYLTYEGTVDIDKITDSHQRSAIISQIKEFGQTPKQLFFTPHPQRLPKDARMEKVPSYSNIPSEAEPLSQTGLLPPMFSLWNNMSQLELEFTFKLHKDSISALFLSSDDHTLYSVAQDGTLKLYSLSERRQLRSVNISDLALSSCFLTQDEKFAIVGSWDNNLYIYSVDYGRIMDGIAIHDDAISCLSLIGNLLLTGSWDASVKECILVCETLPILSLHIYANVNPFLLFLST